MAASKKTFDLHATLTRIAAAGADGLPLNAPDGQQAAVPAVLYTVSPKLTKRQRESAWQAIKPYIEETGATRRFVFGKRKRAAEVPVVRLSPTGRQFLAEQRRTTRLVNATAATPDLDLTDMIVTALPAEGWIEIPRLRANLHEAGIGIGPGALADELRRLHRAGTVRLGAWQRSARELPSPEHAILGPEAVVLYYVSRGT